MDRGTGNLDTELAGTGGTGGWGERYRIQQQRGPPGNEAGTVDREGGAGRRHHRPPRWIDEGRDTERRAVGADGIWARERKSIPHLQLIHTGFVRVSGGKRQRDATVRPQAGNRIDP